MKLRKLKRREFLHLTGAAVIGAAAAACTPATPETIQVERTVEVEKIVEKRVEVEVEREVEVIVEVEVPEARNEPPMLAALVANGTLPPVAERLPMTPFVVGGRDAIGVYGGEVRQIHFDTVWSVSTYDWFADRMLQYSEVDLRTLVPCILESWEASDDGTTFTMHIRRGMKWSDGAPVTTEDVDFWWNSWATAEGVGWVSEAFNGIQNQRCQIEIIDDFSFRATYDYPFGIFPHVLTRTGGGGGVDGPFMAKHFLQDYHIDYAGEAALEALMSELGVETWQNVLGRFAAWGLNVWQYPEYAQGFPTLSGWIPVAYPAEGLILFERNPYYWKVDVVGNQLPYIDKLRLDYVASPEAMTLKMIGGELDWLGMHEVTIASYPLYKENEDQGRYVVGDYLTSMVDRYILYPRHHLPSDPVLQEVVQHPNFVKALSVAIDREEINESLFYGMARMGQFAPMPSSKYYKPAYATAWAQYDPALANQLLDEMGLNRRDGAGFRLRPDGQRLSYSIEHAGIRVGASVHEFTEMVTTYWREIGIEATTKEIAESLYNQRMQADEIHVGVWHSHGCTDMLLPIDIIRYVTGSSAQGGASAAWQRWYTAVDKEAEGMVTPPETIQQYYAWIDEMRSVVNENERIAIGQRVFDALAETPLAIGIVVESPSPLIINRNMRNLPRPKMPMGWDSYGVNTYHPGAFYFEDGKRA
jgi:peptide/nickel transport system substrate-binding protein